MSNPRATRRINVMGLSVIARTETITPEADGGFKATYHVAASDAGWLRDAFCACGHVKAECDGTRAACVKPAQPGEQPQADEREAVAFLLLTPEFLAGTSDIKYEARGGTFIIMHRTGDGSLMVRNLDPAVVARRLGRWEPDIKWLRWHPDLDDLQARGELIESITGP